MEAGSRPKNLTTPRIRGDFLTVERERERARSMAPRAARPTSFLSCHRTSMGNPGGSPEATRRLVNKAFLEALAEDFRQGGPEAIAKVRKQQPAAYMKICRSEERRVGKECKFRM